MSQGYTRNTVNANLPTGATGTVLQGAGTGVTPTYSTPTYPSASGTSRKILVSDGTNNVYSTETWAVPGTSGNLLTSDGTNWTSAANTAGTFVKQVRTSTSATTALATDVNSASSFPNTQGTQIMSVSITPAASGNVLVFSGNVLIPLISTGTGGPLLVYVGVFKTGTTNAIWVTCAHLDYTGVAGSTIFLTTNIPISYYQSAGGTSSQTFTVRAGAATAGSYTGTTTSTLNSIASGGGSSLNPLSTFFIEEYTS